VTTSRSLPPRARQIEPSAGVGVAVALSSEFRRLLDSKFPDPQVRASLRIGVVLCGGNADPVKLAPHLASAPPFPEGALVNE